MNLKQISKDNPVIIFDGECHLCDHSVQFVLKRDKNAIFRFSTLQFTKAQNILPINTDSVILLENGEIYIRSIAAIKIMGHLGGFYKILSVIAGVVPTFIADKFYDIIAKNRYKWFGKYDVCLIPDPKWKDRFLP